MNDAGLIAILSQLGITIDAVKRSGKPCIRGLRITVEDVIGYLEAGMSEEDILDDFPQLNAEDIALCRKIKQNDNL